MIYWKHKRLHISRDISASPGRVWLIVTDTYLWSQWGPSVRSVESEKRFIAHQTSGRVETSLGFWLPFRITRYVPLHYWGWRIGPFTATGHSLRSQGSRNCTLAFDMPWWAFFYLPICWLALHKIARLAAHTNPHALDADAG